MISREDFIFTIGYDGDTAIVDGRSKRSYGRMSTEDLVREGLFKPALCSALYANDEKALEMVLDQFNRRTETKIASVDLLKRLLGITVVPEDIHKTMVC